jgi:hypothetical protein
VQQDLQEAQKGNLSHVTVEAHAETADSISQISVENIESFQQLLCLGKRIEAQRRRVAISRPDGDLK